MSNHLPLYEYGSIRKATEKYTAKGRHKQRDEFLISSGILKSRSSETVFGDSLKSSPDSWNDDKSECSSVNRLVSKLSVCLVTFIKTVKHCWAIYALINILFQQVVINFFRDKAYWNNLYT